MKKVLFSVMLTAITMALFAQETVGYTTYDLQSNVGSCRRVAMDAAGNIAITYTKSHIENNDAPGDRGSGYNYFNGTSWSEGVDFSGAPGTTFTRPDAGRTGWPNIAFLGTGDVAISSHYASSTSTSDGLSFIFKDVAASSWSQSPDADTLTKNDDATWSRMATSGDSIIIISTGFENDVFGMTGGLLMYRSYDAGASWIGPDPIQHVNPTNFPVRDAAERSLGADAYAIDANDDGTVAIITGHYNNFVIKSTDFGNNWTLTPVVTTVDGAGTPNPNYGGNNGQTLDTLNGADAAYSIIVDDNGDVHAWWGLSIQLKEDAGAEGTNYFPLLSNLQYWNESMTAPMTIASTEIRPEQTGECGALFPNDINDSEQNALYGAGYVSQSSGGYDENGNLYVAYSGMRAAIVDEDGIGTNVNDAGLLYKDVFLLKSEDGGATWIGPMNVSDEPNMECVHPGIPRKIYGSEIPVIWQQDDEPGSFIQSPTGYTVPFTRNYIMYESVVSADIEETYPWIDLLGLESVDLIVGTPYNDAGLDLPDDATCWTFTENDNINNALVGTYEYVYTVTRDGLSIDDEDYVFDVVREVNVIATDVTPPVITVFNNGVDTVEACDTWTDPGATAFDNIDYDNVSIDNVVGTVNTAIPGDYTITYESEDNAGNTGSEDLIVTVIDRTGPAIDFTDNPVYHCLGSTFTAPTATYTDCVTTTFDATNTSTDAGDVDVNMADTYIVDYIATDDAGNSDTIGLPVIVGLSPSVSDFSSSPNGNTYIFFTGASQTTNSPTNWEWDFGDGTPLTSGTSTTHTYTAEGTYNVCVTVSNQFNAICGDPLASFCKSVLVGGSGINDKELDATINIYPNPNTGKFEVTIADTKASDLNISITNMIGETIVTSNITVNGSTTETFDLGQKASGVYFVTIASEDAATTERVIVR